MPGTFRVRFLCVCVKIVSWNKVVIGNVWQSKWSPKFLTLSTCIYLYFYIGGYTCIYLHIRGKNTVCVCTHACACLCVSMYTHFFLCFNAPARGSDGFSFLLTTSFGTIQKFLPLEHKPRGYWKLILLSMPSPNSF